MTTRATFRWATRVVAVALISALTWATVPSARAHVEIEERSPAPDARLDIAPREVVLTFGAEPLSVGVAVVVVDATGQTWQTGEPSVAHTTVTQQLRGPLPAGSYEVRWRVVADDGHPL
ncbi:MAG: copper resistance protein CopC, partial [Propioniciclava sp.]